MKLALPLVAAILLVSCNRSDVNSKEAVRKGVVDYLDKRKAQTGLDMNLMNVEVTNVTFDKNEAHATVSFRPKDTKSGASGMAMSYVLERRGDEWVVKGRQESGMNPHGGGTPGMPGSGAMGTAPGGPLPETPQLPPNHPPMGGGSEAPKK